MPSPSTSRFMYVEPASKRLAERGYLPLIDLMTSR